MCWYLNGRMILIENENNSQIFNQGYLFGAGLAAAIKDIIPGLANVAGDVLQSDGNSPLHLDNQIISNNLLPPQGDDYMTYKIKRTVDINGSKKTIYAQTEQEYAQKLLIAMGVTSRLAVEQPKHLLSDYCRNWFNTYAKPNIETATAVQYQRAIEVKIVPFFPDRYIEDITVTDLQTFFNSMEGLTKESKLKVKTPLLMIFDMAIEEGLITKNPMKSKLLKITGAKSNETQPYSQGEMRFFVANLGQLEEMCDRHYMALQSMHPLRLEEVLGLQWRDIDIEHNLITIRQVATHPTRNQPEIKAPKTATSARVLPLSPIAKQYLTIGNPDDYVVGGSSPLSYQLVKKMCVRIAKQLGFEGKITPRRFRCTVLSDIYDTTKDIKLTQAMAGHSNSQMTLKHYVKGRMQASQNDYVSKLYCPC